jgi:hypothetical protein
MQKTPRRQATVQMMRHHIIAVLALVLFSVEFSFAARFVFEHEFKQYAD